MPAALSTDWRVVVDDYLDAALDSPHTRRAYRRHLQAAFTWLDGSAVADLTGVQLAAYRAQLTGTGLGRWAPIASPATSSAPPSRRRAAAPGSPTRCSAHTPPRHGVHIPGAFVAVA